MGKKRKHQSGFWETLIILGLVGLGGYYLGAHQERTKQALKEGLPAIKDSAKKMAPKVKEAVASSVTKAKGTYQNLTETMASRYTEETSPQKQNNQSPEENSSSASFARSLP